MNESTIPPNIKRLRRARGYSQGRLAEKLNLSRSAYRNIENGKSEPRVSNLQAIATALDVSIQQLVEPVRALRSVRFRSNKRMRSREQILVDVGRWLSDFDDIEEILDDRMAYKLDDIRRQLKAGENRGKVAANLAREAFGLNTEEPVRDICGLLESNGIKVGEQKVESDGFFGLSVASDNGGPAVVVNTWKGNSVERWIFTAAHELGHLILHQSDYDVNKADVEKKHEKEANDFAAEFLMPDASFQKEWKETYGLALVDRVMKVKRIFRVSYRTVLYRLAASYHDPRNIWVRFQNDFIRRTDETLLRDDEPDPLTEDAFRASVLENSSTDEPDMLSPVDFIQDRLSGLVRKAIEQEKISLGRGAEILSLSLQDMRERTASWVG